MPGGSSYSCESTVPFPETHSRQQFYNDGLPMYEYFSKYYRAYVL